jgi:DNA polymerase-3 subunit gamma/tau
LNCQAEGGLKPCNVCEACAASINSSLDVVEIDAASNNGVDDVRELRDKIALAPTGGRYKVYIIDEVHMLSSGAFNALLKTLEEPPSHAVFILATTEAHKLPETIISRTQRYNFRPITEDDIVEHLGNIAKKEGVKADQDALRLIARTARGGLRDAIGMLDQVATVDEKITVVAVRDLLGIADAAAVAAINAAIGAKDARAALSGLLEVLDQGAQPSQLALQLAADWRAKLAQAVGVVALEAGAADLPPARVIGDSIETLMLASKSPWPRESLEIAVVRLAAGPAAAVAVSVDLAGAAAATAAEKPPRQPASLAAASAPAQAPAPGASSAPSAAAEKPRAKAAENAPAPELAPAPEPAPEPAAQTVREPAKPKTTKAATNLDPALWAKVISALKRSNGSLASLLHMYPDVIFENGKVIVRPKFKFHRDQILKSANRKAIEEVAQKVYGRHIPVDAVTVGEKATKTADHSPESELVTTALDILGGEVVE